MHSWRNRNAFNKLKELFFQKKVKEKKTHLVKSIMQLSTTKPPKAMSAMREGSRGERGDFLWRDLFFFFLTGNQKIDFIFIIFVFFIISNNFMFRDLLTGNHKIDFMFIAFFIIIISNNFKRRDLFFLMGTIK